MGIILRCSVLASVANLLKKVAHNNLQGNYTSCLANLMDCLLIWIKFSPECVIRPCNTDTCECKGTSSICRIC